MELVVNSLVSLSTLANSSVRQESSIYRKPVYVLDEEENIYLISSTVFSFVLNSNSLGG